MHPNWLKYAVVAGTLLLSGPVYAQNSSAGITPCGAGIALSASNVSSNNVLSNCGTSAVVWNTGTVDVFVNWGTASNTAATTSGWPIPAGSSMILNTGRAPLYLAVITGSGTATVRVVQGNGAPIIASGSTSTISGTITANQGTSPWIVAGGGTAGTAATGVVSVQGIASMTPVAVSAASGSFASGSYASGSFASGAFASGSVASGAYASGSLASGAMVDLVALSAPVAPATATATKSTLLGAQATTGAVNPTNGQQAALSSDTNNNLLVSQGGAPNIATAQASVTTGNISVASARALRRAITITNVTGTSAVYCGNTGVTTSTGTYLGSTAGSSITLNTTAAVFCTVAATTQTVTALETY